MPKRLRKQILYGAFYLFIWTFIFVGIYFAFLRPAPSCYDNVKNQDEVEIDCGGVCSGVCSPIKIKSITTFGQILTLRPDAEHMSILAQINNPNLGYMAKRFMYVFTLYDSSDTAITTFQGLSFMYPGEAKYILIPNVPATDFARIEFKAQDMEWITAEEAKAAPNIVPVGAAVNIKEGKLAVEGNVVNNDIIIVSNIKVLAVFVGNLGQIAGASETEIADLSPGAARPFSIIHPNIPNADLTATKIFVYAARP